MPLLLVLSHVAPASADVWITPTMVGLLLVLGSASHANWRSSPFQAWTAALIAESGLLLVALVVSWFVGSGFVVVVAILTIGAVLGAGITHAWQAIERRREAARLDPPAPAARW